MRRRCGSVWGLLAFLTLLLLAGCDHNSPTEPNPPPPPPPPPLPRGIPEALALTNVPLIRSLQEERVPGSILIGIRGSSIRRDGRIRPQEAWAYEFLDPNPNTDTRYAWEVLYDGQIEYFGAMPPLGPASGLDIEPLINFDSDGMASIAQKNGGRDYFDTHPEADIRITYRHFASRVFCTLQYFDLTPTSDHCELTIELDAGTGDFLNREGICM